MKLRWVEREEGGHLGFLGGEGGGDVVGFLKESGFHTLCDEEEGDGVMKRESRSIVYNIEKGSSLLMKSI